VRRQVTPSDPASGYGMVKVAPRRDKTGRRLSEFDAAQTLSRHR
jgi:hypothetical protein